MKRRVEFERRRDEVELPDEYGPFGLRPSLILEEGERVVHAEISVSHGLEILDAVVEVPARMGEQPTEEEA